MASGRRSSVIAGKGSFNAGRRGSVLGDGAAGRRGSVLGDVSQLTSDQNDDEGLVLMVEALEHAPALKVFDSEDLARLSEHLSILEFQEGETVMQKGELATWVGIVLSGKLGAVIDGRTVGHMGVGSVVVAGRAARVAGAAGDGELGAARAGRRAARAVGERRRVSCVERGGEAADVGIAMRSTLYS